ncbi:MAG: FAD-dependent oxidoreductase [Alphaproteobacteria bacterium]|nr:FAD-dependent oxidoreductase [Alphaproteobacteria bacterium]
MPFGLLKYGLSKRYPSKPDFVAPGDLKKSYDIVIVGGGGHGLAVAYHLACYWNIRNICVLDKGYIGGGNTARNTAVIRSNYITPESVNFYAEAVRMYGQLSNELGYNMMMSNRGQLTLAHSDATIRSFRMRAEVSKHRGTEIEVVDRQTIKEIVPNLELDIHAQPILAGLWHPDALTGRHDSVAWGYAVCAMELGVEVHQRTEVTGFEVVGNRVTKVKTSCGDIQCGQVVQAVAGHSSVVAKMVGIRLPIRSYPLQAMVTLPMKPFINPMVSSTALHCYVSQTSRGELVIGGGPDPYELYSTRSSLELKEDLAGHACEMFPFLVDVPILRQWAGIVDMTPDYSPIMGPSELDNYWLDAGWGTWGFKATPASGKYVAQMVAQQKVPEVLQPFGVERFYDFGLVNEMGATAASH